MTKAMRNWGGWVRILCAVALVCVGFAHKPAIAAPRLSPDAAFSHYVLPDGSSAEICVSEHEAGGKGHSGDAGLGTGCEACRLSASILLPAPLASAGEPMAATLALLRPVAAGVIERRAFPPNAAPRAPPLSVLRA